jgi:hypothetical protein
LSDDSFTGSSFSLTIVTTVTSGAAAPTSSVGPSKVCGVVPRRIFEASGTTPASSTEARASGCAWT